MDEHACDGSIFLLSGLKQTTQRKINDVLSMFMRWKREKLTMRPIFGLRSGHTKRSKRFTLAMSPIWSDDNGGRGPFSATGLGRVRHRRSKTRLQVRAAVSEISWEVPGGFLGISVGASTRNPGRILRVVLADLGRFGRRVSACMGISAYNVRI